MLTSLTIERFRGIPSLVLADLGAVNIFVGENACGKTTVLESITLIANPLSPYPVLKLGHWRDLPALTLSNDECISTLFHNKDFRQGPQFSFVVEGVEQKLALDPWEPWTVSPTSFGVSRDGSAAGTKSLEPSAGTPISDDRSSTSSSSSQVFGTPSLIGLKMVFNANATQERATASGLMVTGMGLQFAAPPQPPQSQGCFYISSRCFSSIREMANILTSASRTNQIEGLLKCISSLDNRIRGVESGVHGTEPIVLADIGLPAKLEISLLGDGFCRAALMAIGFFSPTARFVAVDEIDSGIHVSTMPRVWAAMAELATQTGKQLFCTTHSDEMLSHTLEAFAETPDLLRVFRINRLKNGQVKATKYTYDQLRRADFASIDIR